jgi:pseudouridine-5'-phosphate glycosidase/pseudouridine kinase
MLVSEQLGNQSGILFAVPIPPEEEGRAAEIQQAVEQAVRESEEQGLARRGKEVTPWLLARVKELSQGSSVTSSKWADFRIARPEECPDIALIRNNTLAACAIAVKYHELLKGQQEPE